MRDFDAYQDLYCDQPYERYLIYFRKKKILEVLSRYPHRVMLEIGCGLDPIFNSFDSFDQLHIVEPAPRFYANALEQRLAFKWPERVNLINKIFEESVEDFRDVSLDFVILSCLLHEIENPQVFLKTLHGIVSTDSIVHINVPNAHSFHRLLAVEMGLIPDPFQKSDQNVRFKQHHIFDLDRLTRLVSKCGFEVVESGSFSLKPFTHEQMENMLKARLLTLEMLEGMYRMEKYLPNLGSEIFVNLRRIR